MKLLSKNRKANFDYKLLEFFMAGIKLVGSEVKSIREGHVTMNNAHCYFKDGELYVKGLHIAEYKESGKYQNHDPLRERKLLLKKKEIKKLIGSVATKGITIVPVNLLLSDNGYVKIEIALAQGKKDWDKKLKIKERDIDLDTQRNLNNF